VILSINVFDSAFAMTGNNNN